MRFAVTAGLFAAFGSLFGKLGGSQEEIEAMIFKLPSSMSELDKVFNLIYLQTLFLICMLVCNALVCTFYVKALQTSNSSLPATIISTATNYISSALLGLMVFNESTGLLWWCGSSLVVTGLALIAHGNKSDKKNE